MIFYGALVFFWCIFTGFRFVAERVVPRPDFDLIAFFYRVIMHCNLFVILAKYISAKLIF